VGDLMSVDAVTPNVVLFDSDPWNPARAERLTALLRQSPQSKLISLMSLPLPEVVAAQIAAGAVAVFPKLGDQRRLVECVKEHATR
jgi:hypothetical protein